MSAYLKLSRAEAAARLLTLKNPLIVIHTRPDGDAIGSGAALCHFFKSLGEEPVLCAQDKLPDRLAFLTDGITVAEPATLPEGFGDVLTVDVASRAQLGALADALTGEYAPVLQIDHHEKGDCMADSLVEPDTSAAGEVVFYLLTLLEAEGKCPTLSLPLLSCLYASIASDTGGFRFANTAPATHRVAAVLLERGVDAPEINRRLFASRTENDLRAEELVLKSLQVEKGGCIAHVSISLKEREAASLPEECFETAVDIARSLAGVRIAASLKEIALGKFKVSLRANTANVAEVAAVFGGGGHKLAAGCTVEGEDAASVWAKILPYLQKALSDDKNS